MVNFNNKYTMTIDGKNVESDETLSIVNPATEKLIASVPVASKAHLNMAVTAARKALSKWASNSFEERSKLLDKFADAIMENKEELARILTSEQGKPLSFALGEIIKSVQWCKEIAKLKLTSEIIEETEDFVVQKHYCPIGVVGAIIPWNFPVLICMFKIPPALLTGNTVIVKPSPFTPLTTLKIGEIAQEVFPPGVYNTLSGNDDLGPWITEHHDIDKISFTGSSFTGKKVMQSASTNLKRVTLELGGNDVAIVLPDVDPKEIASKLFWASFQNSGQVCINSKRLYIHEDIYDDVLREMVEYAKTINIGDGIDPTTQLGPVQNKNQYEKVKSMINHMKQNNLNIVLGGDEVNREGYFIPVTIVDNPPEDSQIVTEEPFGPIIPLLKYNNYDVVIERANNSPYGLGGSVWGKDIELANKIAMKLETGTVWINEVAVLSPTVPFGGHKQSGIGTEGSIDGLIEYTNNKIIRINKKQTV